MDNAKQSPAWARALERFGGGYGEEFDPAEEWHRVAFLVILEEEVRQDVEAELAAYLRAAARRMEAAV